MTFIREKWPGDVTGIGHVGNSLVTLPAPGVTIGALRLGGRPMRDRGPIDANSVESRNEAKPLRFAGLVLDLDACTLHREPDVAALAERGGAVSDRAQQGEAIA